MMATIETIVIFIYLNPIILQQQFAPSSKQLNGQFAHQLPLSSKLIFILISQLCYFIFRGFSFPTSQSFRIFNKLLTNIHQRVQISMSKNSGQKNRKDGKVQQQLESGQQQNEQRTNNTDQLLTKKELMGNSGSAGTSIISGKFLKSLSTSTPLRSIGQAETEVHEIVCLSPEHHQIMLEKIRIKKNYDCPFIIKIIDSHTLQSKNLCSTIIKTYIVVEKPQTLTEEISQRITLSLGFEESEIWTLIYSCCVGALYLLKNNVNLPRLNSAKIFIDIKGGIKINDPDFSGGPLQCENIREQEYLYSLSEVSQELRSLKKVSYSQKLLDLITEMKKGDKKLLNIQNYIKHHYIDCKKQNFLAEKFSLTRKAKAEVRTKQKLKLLSGSNNKPQDKNRAKEMVYFESLDPRMSSQRNKQNYKSNSVKERQSQNQLLTFKDQIKQPQHFINDGVGLDWHCFPRKALFCQKRRQWQCPVTDWRPVVSPSGTSQKQILTRQSQSVLIETDLSLDESQVINMMSSYQVDQETCVREVCQEQSQYFIQLMNQIKCRSSPNSNWSHPQ